MNKEKIDSRLSLIISAQSDHSDLECLVRTLNEKSYKTYISKKIDSLGLKYTLQKNKNQLLIPESTEKAIKEDYSKSQTVYKQSTNDTANSLQTEIEILRVKLAEKDKQIELLERDNADKREQIKHNTELLNKLEEDLKAELFLRGQAESKILALEDKISENKPGFFARLFGNQ